MDKGGDPKSSSPQRAIRPTFPELRRRLFSEFVAKEETPDLDPVTVTELFGPEDAKDPLPRVMHSLFKRATDPDRKEVWLLIGETRGVSKKKMYFVGLPTEENNTDDLLAGEDGIYTIKLKEQPSGSASLKWTAQPGEVTLHSIYNRDVGMALSQSSDLPKVSLRLLRAHVIPARNVRVFFYGEKTALDGRWARPAMPNLGDLVVLPDVWNPKTEKFKIGWELRRIEAAEPGRPDPDPDPDPEREPGEGGTMIMDGSLSFFYGKTDAEKQPGKKERRPLILSPVVRHLKLRPGQMILPIEEHKNMWRYLEDFVIIIEGPAFDIARLEESGQEEVERLTVEAATGDDLLKEPKEGFPRQPTKRRSMPIPRRFRPHTVRPMETVVMPPSSWGGFFKENIPLPVGVQSGTSPRRTEEEIMAALRTE